MRVALEKNLERIPPACEPAETSNNVALLQRQLAYWASTSGNRDLDPGEQSGWYGPGTSRAVLAWQRIIWGGYTEEYDGVWGERTRRRTAEFVTDGAHLMPTPGPSRSEPTVETAVNRSQQRWAHNQPPAWDTPQRFTPPPPPPPPPSGRVKVGDAASVVRSEPAKPSAQLIQPSPDVLVSAKDLHLLKAAQDVSDAQFWSWAAQKDRVLRVVRTAIQALVGGIAGFIVTVLIPAATVGHWYTWDHIRLVLLALIVVPVLTTVAAGMQNLFNIGPTPTPPAPTSEPTPAAPAAGQTV